MKQRIFRKSLSICLVVLMILGMSAISASTHCTCPPHYWILNFDAEFVYYQNNSEQHTVLKKDIAYCRLCGAEWVSCTHWYSESHDFTTYYLGFVESIQMHEYEDICFDCNYSRIYYLP